MSILIKTQANENILEWRSVLHARGRNEGLLHFTHTRELFPLVVNYCVST